MHQHVKACLNAAATLRGHAARIRAAAALTGLLLAAAGCVAPDAGYAVAPEPAPVYVAPSYAPSYAPPVVVIPSSRPFYRGRPPIRRPIRPPQHIRPGRPGRPPVHAGPPAHGRPGGGHAPSQGHGGGRPDQRRP